MQTIISIGHIGRDTTVEVKHNGRYEIVAGKCDKFPLALIARAIVKLRFRPLVQYLHALRNEALGSLVSFILILTVFVLGCFDLANSPEWTVQLFYWLLVAIFATAALLALFTFLILNPVILPKLERRAAEPSWRDRHPFLAEYIDIILEGRPR